MHDTQYKAYSIRMFDMRNAKIQFRNMQKLFHPANQITLSLFLRFPTKSTRNKTIRSLWRFMIHEFTSLSFLYRTLDLFSQAAF